MDKKNELHVVNSPTAGGMNRREVVRRLVSGAGGAFVFPGVAAWHPIHRHLANAATLERAEQKAAAAAWKPEFLDAHQGETLAALAERMIPGSTKAQVAPFIDLLLSVDTQENQKKFLAALGAFEAEGISRHSKPYKELTEAEQVEILTAASTMKSGHEEGQRNYAWFQVPSGVERPPERDTLRDYFENLKGWVSGAYYSSEVGMKELGWTGEMYFDSFPGCQHPEGHH